ncbi:hypothetical protein HK099_007424 [Clydaea vesicula]|uniref:Uncharacterized protein n=1 Tax=Clydaea vesicula TaxID=447962 RepID=A0AAD5XWE1_9FUNG|nr:hypothetical protein HK099_007424 [Clydaea vesicula]KAJ3380957.1 hypothetical protein HDU92_005672 [Lobulomyces angularis]
MNPFSTTTTKRFQDFTLLTPSRSEEEDANREEEDYLKYGLDRYFSPAPTDSNCEFKLNDNYFNNNLNFKSCKEFSSNLEEVPLEENDLELEEEIYFKENKTPQDYKKCKEHIKPKVREAFAELNIVDFEEHKKNIGKYYVDEYEVFLVKSVRSRLPTVNTTPSLKKSVRSRKIFNPKIKIATKKLA